jgi:hypothetical protein
MCIFAAAPVAAAGAATAAGATAATATSTALASALQLASIATGIVGAGMSAYGAFQSSQAEKAAAKTQAKINANNQKVAEWQAQDAIKRGGEQDIESRRRYAQIGGTQRTALAGKGIDIGEGTALDMLEDTSIFEGIDSGRIRDNAEREAYGFRFQGANYGAQSSIYKTAASGYSPFISGGGTLLTGAGDVAERWLRYRGAY